MLSSFALHLGAQLLAGVVSLAVAFWVQRRDSGEAGRYMSYMLVLGALWSLLLALQVLAPTIELTRATIYGWQLVSWLFVPYWVLFVLSYTGRDYWLTPRVKAGMGVLFGGGAAMIVADPVLGFAFTGFRVADQPFQHLVPVRGAGALLLLAVGYAFLLWGYVLLVQLFFRSRSVSRFQSLSLLAAGLVPLVLSVMRDLDLLLPRYDYTAIGIGLSSVLLAISLFRQRLLDVEPLARDIVVDAIGDAVIVVDDDFRIVDCNEPAVELFPRLGDALGDRLHAIFPRLIDTGTTTATFVEELTVETGDERATYSVVPTAITRRDSIRGYVVVLQDVTELTEYADQLEEQTDHLERVASTISHDLRNPLHVVLSTIEHAEETGSVAELYRAKNAVDRMDAIIQDTLTLARQGQAIDERAFVSLSAVTRDAWSVAETGDARLVVDVPGNCRIYADDNRFQRVLENLFRNAVEHGDATTVRVETFENGFAVTDDGTGFPNGPADVFEHGYTTAEDGTGFGLAIVDAIASAHGWEVRATEASDGGARFEFEGVALTESTETEVPVSAE